MLETMTYRQIEAFIAYCKALLDGQVEPPEGAELNAEAREVLERTIRLHNVFRTYDYNSTQEAIDAIVIAGPLMMEAALDFMPTARRLN